MPHDSDWLRKTMGIIQGHPYQSILILASDEQNQTPGIAIFHVENGTVGFEFYIGAHTDLENYQKLLHSAKEAIQGTDGFYIAVPAAELKHPALLTTLPPIPYDARPVNGVLAGPAMTEASSFGEGDHPMNHVVVEFLDLPSRWGYGKLAYQYATSRCPIKFSEDGKHILLPAGTSGARALSGCTISADGWTADIQEIPSERRRNQRVTHQCIFTRADGDTTGTTAWKFFENELWPFLCFMFAHKVQVTHMIGTSWVRLRSVRPEAIHTLGKNWFLTARHQSIDPQILFQQFHSQDDQTKRHWRKVIDRYATSEEIIATFGDSETAQAVSFAGLEGLTRSIISRYSDRNQWLNRKLELDPKSPKRDGGKAGIIDAIEMVLRRELATDNPELPDHLSQLAKLRNSTSHTDLQSDPDWENAYHRWNASQALIEILLLRQMRLGAIPNRTMYGTFSFMGHDMYKGVRKEAILPPRCQGCGEWTGTLTHEVCNQDLCTLCWENHNQSGCTDAVYPPAQ